MTKFTVPMLLLSVFLIGIVVLADVTRTAETNWEQTSYVGDAEAHNHPPLSADEWDRTPSIDLYLIEDTMMGGWNLQLDTKHFEFTPAEVNTPSRENSGHAHLFINERKYARLYSNWFYIEPMPPGEYTVKVTLNSNMHEELTLNGKSIEAIAQLFQE